MWGARYIIEEREDGLTVYFKNGLALRLFGLPFLIVGGKFLYELLQGIYESIIQGEMLLFFPGTLLVIAMILVFGVPGWLLTFLRKSVTIDRVRAEVVDMLDFLVYKRVRRYPFAALRKVLVTRRRQKYKRQLGVEKVSTVYPIELVAKDDKKILVGELEEREPAKLLAGQLAEIIGVEVELDIRRLQGAST